MFCNKCGATLVVNARFCNICGAPVPFAAANVNPAPAPERSAAENNPAPVLNPFAANVNPAPERSAAENNPAAVQNPVFVSSQPLFAPSKFHIMFQFANDGQFKTGFHMGGAVSEGYLELTTDSMKLYKKSVGVALAFGMIGSAIEGKGKFQEEIPRTSVVSYTKTRNKKEKVYGYTMNLRDGRSFKVHFTGRGKAEDDPDIKIFDRFLTQTIDGRVP